MNHQDIADRLKALGTEKSAALAREEARIEAERQSLRELCGGLGHIYTEMRHEWTWVAGGPPTAPKYARRCCVCDRVES